MFKVKEEIQQGQPISNSPFSGINIDQEIEKILGNEKLISKCVQFNYDKIQFP